MMCYKLTQLKHHNRNFSKEKFKKLIPMHLNDLVASSIFIRIVLTKHIFIRLNRPKNKNRLSHSKVPHFVTYHPGYFLDIVILRQCVIYNGRNISKYPNYLEIFLQRYNTKMVPFNEESSSISFRRNLKSRSIRYKRNSANHFY